MIKSHSQSKDLDSDAYQKVLEILQKESGPRFSVMKEDMNSIKEGDKGKSYSYLLENHISKFLRNLCLRLQCRKTLKYVCTKYIANLFSIFTYIFPCRSKRSKLD